MAVANYHAVDGFIEGEEATIGSGVRSYGTDALGSVCQTFDSTGAAENSYRNKPYGGLLQKTGIASDSAFTWVGSLGYRGTSRDYSETYVRARHYATSLTRWATVDPLMPNSSPYAYTGGNPTCRIDPSGLFYMAWQDCCCSLDHFAYTVATKFEGKARPNDKGISFGFNVVIYNVISPKVRDGLGRSCSLRVWEYYKCSANNGTCLDAVTDYGAPNVWNRRDDKIAFGAMSDDFSNGQVNLITKKGCSGTLSKTYYDKPSIPESGIIDLVLCQYVSVTNGCTGAMQQHYATYHLGFSNGLKTAWNASDYGPVDADAVVFCIRAGTPPAG